MRHFFLFLFFFLYISAQSQDTFIHWIASDQDEYVKFTDPYESDRILVNLMQGEYSTDYEELFTNYVNKLIKMNYDFEILKTAEINKIDGKEIIIYGVLEKLSESIVLWGRAMDLSNMDNQLVIIHVDMDLAVIDYSFYGNETQNEYFTSGIKDMNGNYIFTGTTSLETNQGDMVFLKVNAMGEELIYAINTNLQTYHTKLLARETNDYYFSNAYNLYRTDTDFNILEMYPFSDTLLVSPSGDIAWYAENKLAAAGTYLAPPVPGSPWVIDIGYLLFNENYEAIAQQTMGAYDTTDFGSSVAVSGWDTLYFDGDKNFSNNPIKNSWVSVYKTQDVNLLDEWHIGGEGQYSTATLEALENGGFILGANAWDFENYPGDQKQRDVILFSQNYGDTLVGDKSIEKNVEISIFPQPAKDQINVLQPYTQLLVKIFDSKGDLVLEKHIPHKASIQIEKLPAGIYFYQMIREKRLLKKGKLLKVNK